ncbi:MAG: CocE/NonD family hydrolase [Proteobacteria bacterium]|nr:CocE/NonD family hydrolase [Pseudomonadota bacterium]
MARVLIAALVVALLAIATPCESREQTTVELRNSSQFVTMRDGVDIAVDTWVPKAVPPKGLPTVLLLTRYWRARANPSGREQDDTNFKMATMFAQAGYALAIADVRGSGASFGSRSTEFSSAEVADYSEVIQWLAARPWSNGRIATTGSSYLGNSAELAAIGSPPALKAAVPRFNDFDTYRHAVFPGGVPNIVLLSGWGQIVDALDANDACALVGPDCDPRSPQGLGVKAATTAGSARLTAAVKGHARNLDVTSLSGTLVYSDDSFSSDGDPAVTLSSVSPSLRRAAIDDAGVPMYFWASWFDAGTADGALSRYMTYKTPMRLIIGAWNHGGSLNADPYLPEPGPAVGPSVPEQYEQIFAFLDLYLKGAAPPPMKREIRYFTLGTNEWRTSEQWPPAGVAMRPLHLGRDRMLRADAAVGESGVDRYDVDFQTSSGAQNRWHTQLGTPVHYGDRTPASRKLLTYTTAPLQQVVEITGHAVLDLWLASTRDDGALHVYLEDVAADGSATYLTEGVFRLQHRRLDTAPPAYRTFGPVHSFARKDAQPMPAGSAERVSFPLLPVSVVVQQGHRLRLAIAGADAGTFARIPAAGDPPVYSVHWGAAMPSQLWLPVAGSYGAFP